MLHARVPFHVRYQAGALRLGGNFLELATTGLDHLRFGQCTDDGDDPERDEDGIDTPRANHIADYRPTSASLFQC